MYFCIACETGFYRQTVCKFRMVLLIFLCHMDSLRIRSHNRHLTPEYIKKLRQFIQMRCHKEMPSTYPLCRIYFCVSYRSCTEFVLSKMLTISGETFLPDQYRSTICNFNIECDQQIQP